MKFYVVTAVVLLGYCNSVLTEKIGLIHMHGLSEHWSVHSNFKEYIEANTDIDGVHLIDAFNNLKSIYNRIWYQVDVVREKVKKIAADYDKIIAVGYSQGGVIWRGIIETWDDHNVDTFIAIASPLSGVYGAPEIATKLIPWLDGYARNGIYWPIYYLGLQRLALFNYYKDPTHMSIYLKKSHFLPDINNERGKEDTKARYKANFLKLRKLVMVGGPGDDVVDPWVSTQFGFYSDKGFDEEPVTMEETRVYKDDLFGLKTLDKAGGVVACTFNGINHLQFRDYRPMLDVCVVPAVEEAIKVNT